MNLRPASRSRNHTTRRKGCRDGCWHSGPRSDPHGRSVLDSSGLARLPEDRHLASKRAHPLGRAGDASPYRAGAIAQRIGVGRGGC